MRIAVIAADLFPEKLGGAEQHLVEVVKQLQEKNEFYIFVGNKKSIKKEFSQKVKIFTVSYPKITNLYGIAYIIWGYPQIKKVLSKINVDVIWAKQSYPQAPLAVLLKKRIKKPVYVTAQNPALHLEELVTKGALLQPFSKSLASLITPIIKWSFRNSDVVAAVSSYSAKLAKKMGAQKVNVIPNGVDVKKFTKRKNRNENRVTILTTSALIPRNGVDTLIQAVSKIPQAINWQLMIAGSGPEKNKLINLASSLGIESRVNFLGRVENNRISNLLSKADIFVRLSRHEGFGVSFLEALASGVPVIATKVGGIPDFIKDEETGLLLEPDDPESASKEITRVITDQELARKLSKNGRILVEQKYSWKKIANEVEKEFISLI